VALDSKQIAERWILAMLMLRWLVCRALNVCQNWSC